MNPALPKKIETIRKGGMNTVLISPEVVPYAKTGGLADVAGALPKALNANGCKCSIIMPLYQLVRKNGFNPKIVKSGIKLNMGPREVRFTLRFLADDKAKVYFIENDELYDRPELYGTPKGDYPDNAARFGFFAKAAAAVIADMGRVDIVHCNDWQSALIPLYLKFANMDKKTGTLFTIHNMAYQGLFEKDVMQALDLPEDLFIPDALEFYGKLSFMKAGIIYSDAINTVSKGYASQILTQEFGCGLDGLLRTRSSSLYGILNGANYDEWNPKTDKYIAANFDSKTIAKKKECKRDLLKAFGLPFDERKFVVGMITRLADQKGIDLVAGRMEDILSMGAYFVLLGTGDERYNELFKSLAQKHKKSVGVKIAFDNALAHKIEAGSDMFLMPSRYEPCGLNQMYSLKYGTIPVVRSTGGLDDTIEDYNPASKKGNGFKFDDASGDALFAALKRAADTYKDKKRWAALQETATRCDFSWDRSAREYAGLYEDILSKKGL